MKTLQVKWELPDPLAAPPPAYLGALGPTGRTAYVGLEIGRPAPGDTVVVSAAGGPREQMVPGTTGIVCGPSPEEWVRATATLLTDGDRRRERGFNQTSASGFDNRAGKSGGISRRNRKNAANAGRRTGKIRRERP